MLSSIQGSIRHFECSRSFRMWFDCITRRRNFGRQIRKEKLLGSTNHLYERMPIIFPINSDRLSVGQKLLPQRSMLRPQSAGFRHILWTCHHNDPKYFAFESARKCHFTILFLYNSCPDYLSYYFRLGRQLNRMPYNTEVVRPSHHSLRRLWILGLTYLLVSWRKSLQRAHGCERPGGRHRVIYIKFWNKDNVFHRIS